MMREPVLSKTRRRSASLSHGSTSPVVRPAFQQRDPCNGVYFELAYPKARGRTGVHRSLSDDRCPTLFSFQRPRAREHTGGLSGFGGRTTPELFGGVATRHRKASAATTYYLRYGCLCQEPHVPGLRCESSQRADSGSAGEVYPPGSGCQPPEPMWRPARSRTAHPPAPGLARRRRFTAPVRTWASDAPIRRRGGMGCGGRLREDG